MESDQSLIKFQTCNSSKTEQQWAILKTKNDQHDYIRVCQRVKIGRFYKYIGSSGTHYCLVADSKALMPDTYQEITVLDNPTNPFFKKSIPMEPNKEARLVKL